MSGSFPALVISVGRNAAWIALESEMQLRMAAFKRAAGKRSMPVPGDRVSVSLLEDGSALVERIEPRTFTLYRRTGKGREKTIAANVDLLATVTSLANPPPRLRTLDQLLAFAELESIEPLVVFTKPDVADAQTREQLTAVYQSIGYRTVVVNPKAGESMTALRAELEPRRSLLCGASGVGKSSIFRALGGEAVIGDLSDRGLGRQTTSTARLFRFAHGFLIDSPGIAEFGLGAITPAELAQAFREMVEPARACRFSDCTHLHEPGCAVKAAVESGQIAESRYASFRSILNL